MTIQTVGDEKVLGAIREKQPHKLVDAARQRAGTERTLSGNHAGENPCQRLRTEEVKRNTEIFRGQIIDVTPTLYTVQLAGTSDKLMLFLLPLRDVAKIMKRRCSGKSSALSRGDKGMR